MDNIIRERGSSGRLPSSGSKVTVVCVCVCVFLVFLRAHKALDLGEPQFTMRRKMEQLREELELMEQLREVRMAEKKKIKWFLKHISNVFFFFCPTTEHREQTKSGPS